jgi:hypothetical protein|tara:strand:- start:983 stop:1246 length:264 start_codon:yes stop_codon:yes gene_type:complete
MDRLVKFCLPLDLQAWMNQYQAPESENALVKDIPNTLDNHMMAFQLAKVVPIRIKYRGPSTEFYKRPSDFCHKAHATRFALYERKTG